MADNGTHWQSRIVGEGEERPDQLLANPRNWRVHPKSQQDALERLLDKVGWVQRVIVNQRTGHVVDGHLRVAMAISRNEPTVPVQYVDLSEDEEALVLASLDWSAGLAVADTEMLGDILESIEIDGVDELLADIATGFAIDIIDITSTDRDGQGVSSTWAQVQPTDFQRVVVGDIETRLSAEVADRLRSALVHCYEQYGTPIFETLESIIVAGLDEHVCDS